MGRFLRIEVSSTSLRRVPHEYRWHRCAAYVKRSPGTATADEIRLFQLHLTETGTSICNRNRIMTGLRFLFRVTLRRLDLAAEIYHIKEPQKTPLVMSPDEPKRLWPWRGISRFTYCSLSATAQVCARARWSGSGLVISTGRRTSSASCRPRGAKTATSCCRQRRSICCGNGGRCDRLVTIRACRKSSAGCSLAASQESR